MAFRIRQIGAPLAIMVWQAAPVTVGESGTAYRISFGVGAGDVAARIASCAGDDYAERRVRHRTVGVRADIVPAESPGRFTVFGGLRQYTSEVQEGTVAWPSLEGRSDWFLGGSTGVQTKYFGFEIGAAFSPVDTLQSGNAVPLGSLRIGNEDRLHLRFDLNAPGIAHRAMGDFRLGLGWRRGRVRGWSGYAGLSACPMCTVFDSDVGVFMETAVPVSGRSDLIAQGSAASTGFGGQTWFLGLGARVHF